MQRAALLCLFGSVWYAQGALAQASSATQPPPPAAPSATAPSTSPPSAPSPSSKPAPPATSSLSSTAAAQPSRDANYPKPSGQDSQPNNKPSPPKKSMTSGSSQGNPEARGSRTADQSAAAQRAVRQPMSRHNIAKKPDPGTACSTARPTKNGGVDCGMGGEGATPGKVPK